MSSYVIDKFAYIRAAGVVAGIVGTYNSKTRREIFIFDYEAGHRMTEEDFYRRFVQCFDMNCLSVQEQYHDEEPFTDSSEYRDVFREYIALGSKLAFNVKAMQDMIYNLQRFFDSCLYQVEKYAYLFNMKAFFYEIIVKLWEVLDADDERGSKSYNIFEARQDE